MGGNALQSGLKRFISLISKLSKLILNFLPSTANLLYNSSIPDTGSDMDLFDHAMQERMSREAPLAARMRPRNLEEFLGQEDIIGEGKLLRRAIQADRLFSSIILWGPPGTGKTTLAQLIANYSQSQFESMSAVMAGKEELKSVIEGAKERRRLYNKRTILFVDEVHRTTHFTY